MKYLKFIISFCIIIGSTAAWSADQNDTDYLGIILKDGPNTTKSQIASENIYALDSQMTVIYGDRLEQFKKQFRQRYPIIIATFDKVGGQMILYPPGKEPIYGDPVPDIYQALKSTGHSTLAVYELVAPYLNNPEDTAWRGPMQGYLAYNQSALETLPDLDTTESNKATIKFILETNIAFMNNALKSGKFSQKEILKYAEKVRPHLVPVMLGAAKAQVTHWEGVLKKWKAMLGDNWQKTYAVAQSTYVTRRKNILFTILVQVMGEKAINDHLLLLETTGFESEPGPLLDGLTRIVADRAVGGIFFKVPQLMDVGLLGDAAVQAVKDDATKEYPAKLPSNAPYVTHQWPWQTYKAPKGKEEPSTMEELDLLPKDKK